MIRELTQFSCFSSDPSSIAWKTSSGSLKALEQDDATGSFLLNPRFTIPLTKRFHGIPEQDRFYCVLKYQF